MNKPQGNKARFGTFAGVFTPNVLTILGIILFLRTGWVVGQAGLLGALFIILLSNLVSLLTGLSLSSIATNMQVKTGGAYYMISRTLGLEIGGAIGIPLYLSQAVSVAFYIIGFTEALTIVFPGFDPKIVSLTVVLLFGFLAFVGADFTLKIQLFILAILALALLSFFSGGWGTLVKLHLAVPTGATENFWSVFAIFFPAVTGIMVGVSFSGDLRNPAKSIPLGTLLSVGITFFIYMVAAAWMGLHGGPEDLRQDPMIMEKIARWPVLIIAGVWASTLSSALGSILAAPRTLQALSFDRALPGIFSHQLGSKTEPRFAVLVTTAVAVMIIMMGDLNAVASVISMFFLNTYGMVNLTAGMERLVGNPSFRPTFRVHWIFSLIGGLGCYGAMFLIHPTATVIAILISYGIYFYLKHRAFRRGWGDIRRGLWFSLIRFGLIRLDATPWHIRNWRPNILAFTGTAGTSHSREQLMELASWLSGGGGIVTLCHLIVGDIDELTEHDFRKASSESLKKYLREGGVEAFVGCSVVSDLHEGIITALQVHGISGLEPNTALIGLSHKPDIRREQFHLMRKMVAVDKSVLYLHFNEERGYGRKKRIDIWWRGRDRNADLMLILAYILTRSVPWEGAEIRILRLVENEEGLHGVEEHMRNLINSVRVDAVPVVMLKDHPEQPFQSVFHSASLETDLTFLGVPVPKVEAFDSAIRFLEDMLHPSSPSVLFVRSAETDPILE
ncbi:MAG: amino acid permease [Deltaproteobacteria bacterium]|nr:amino acid permease [Deltaproteobacteria bacterium]